MSESECQIQFTVDNNCFETFQETSYLDSCSFYIEVRIREVFMDVFKLSSSYQGVLLTCFSVLGIFANTITIIVLSRYNVRSTFTKLLSSLAVIDTLLLLVFLVDSGLERLELNAHLSWYTHLIPAVHAVKVLPLVLSLDLTEISISAHDHHWLDIHGGGHLYREVPRHSQSLQRVSHLAPLPHIRHLSQCSRKSSKVSRI